MISPTSGLVNRFLTRHPFRRRDAVPALMSAVSAVKVLVRRSVHNLRHVATLDRARRHARATTALTVIPIPVSVMTSTVASRVATRHHRLTTRTTLTKVGSLVSRKISHTTNTTPSLLPSSVPSAKGRESVTSVARASVDPRLTRH